MTPADAEKLKEAHARLRAAAQAVVDEWESATSTTVDRAIVVNALAAELEGGSE